LEFAYSDPRPIAATPEKIDLDILYEDQDVIVVNKAQGMVVHPGCGNASGTLVNALLYYCAQLQHNFSGEPIRPGIVHRLDRDTSGVIIVAKHAAAHGYLADQFKNRRVQKQYLAIVYGTPPQTSGEIATRIFRDPRHRQRFTTRSGSKTGKTALTHYRVLKRLKGSTLLSLRPRTGRTHQLRVHMKYLGCPILADPIYGRPDPGITLMLHAFRLGLHLLDGSKTVFKAPLPSRFKTFLKDFNVNQD
jgi:23S rRNA pseudouridine1911/1915/1917 synthase